MAADVPQIRFARHKEDWEALADFDPLWAILSDPGKIGRRWQLTEFFDSGQAEVEQVVARFGELGLPEKRRSCLDFGCGVGRLTRAFSPHFTHCVGVDVAERMVAEARALNASLTRCEFLVNPRPDLALFANDSFDMIYTNIVLQHLPDRETIRRYIVEFVRILEPRGLLVFQLPCHIPWFSRLMLRRRLYLVLRRLGLSDRFLHLRLHLTNMRMNHLSVDSIVELLRSQGAIVRDVVRCPSGAVESATYYATKD